jgi:hypothetical protein
MAKDPAFLFYPGDASDDTQFMNRLERGCYFDLLKAQKKHRKFSIQLIQKVLGRDFESCWPAIELILQKDGDLYFIGWVHESMENRAAHSEKQKKRIKDYWDKKKQSESIPEPIQTNTTEQPIQNGGITLENENAIENGNENAIAIKGVQGEKRKDKLEIFEEIFTDELFVSDLSRMYPKKNLQEAFEKCWLWHIQKPSPPTEGWEWRQKLTTWLNSKQPLHGQGKSAHDSKSRIDEIIENRHGSG